AAFDGWVDAGSSATAATKLLAVSSRIVAEFDGDQLFDYRARRPTLEIQDGKPERLTWPTLQLRHRRIGERDVLVLSGAEPDFKWRRFAAELVEIARRLKVAQWISLGAIPAAVPHTRPVPILGTASGPGLLRGDVQAGPDGLLRVPAACISVVDVAISRAGIPAVGYFAQIPHYVSGEYPGASAELLRAVGRHLDIEPPMGDLTEEARLLRKRLDTAAALDDKTRQYVERLEAMVDESRLPAGDDLIADIERFLRDQGTELGGGGRPN
ncbi:MAG TPA: PAC2 family protein, partial [Candidatus Sulfomarinibacteraceae bacterium]|nr:PAC2 family protein [Candidatus Sulfomarinibacteraceae bacterium]